MKPYRDNLPQIEGYNVTVLKDKQLGEKAQKIAEDNTRYSVTNLALNLLSQTYSERGKELEQMICDAQTKQAGGSNMMEEYKADFEKTRKKK